MTEPESSVDQVAGLTRRLLREGVVLAGRIGLDGMHETDRRALAMLDELGAVGRASPSVLAERLDLSRGAVTSLVDRLCRAGLVERQSVPGDGRRVALVLTGHARELGARHLREWTSRIDEAAGRLSATDAQVVGRYLFSLLDRPPSGDDSPNLT